MSQAQTARFTELANHHPAVAADPLPNGTLSLVARDDDGAIIAAELIAQDGQTLGTDDVVRVLGAIRSDALRVAELVTERLAVHLALQAQDPDAEEPSLRAIARDTGIARQTLYNRLEADPLKAPTPPADAEPTPAPAPAELTPAST